MNMNTGNYNTGDRSTGDYNTGDYNTGNWNTGSWNTGNGNTGNWNAGNRNTGSDNTGSRNSGNYNTGNYNTGDYNAGNHNTGFFNCETPTFSLFDATTEITAENFVSSRAYYVVRSIVASPHVWLFWQNMTPQERDTYRGCEINGGHLKRLSQDEQDRKSQQNYNDLADAEKKMIQNLPNFDAKKFKICTGIDVCESKRCGLRDYTEEELLEELTQRAK